MPEISPLGWFHTVLGIVALLSGALALFKFREISTQSASGKIYLLATLITAATALAIFQHGGFGAAHALAVMTIAALFVGFVAETMQPIGRYSRHLRAFSYSATLLFHCIPAVTDGLMRLPVGNPIVTSIEDPLLRKCYLALLIAFLVGVVLQLRWVHRQANVDNDLTQSV